jgi:hypothetical protein
MDVVHHIKVSFCGFHALNFDGGNFGEWMFFDDDVVFAAADGMRSSFAALV